MTELNKQLYIHIGPQKTGTTSLNNFLLNNTSILAAHGCRMLHSKMSSFSWLLNHQHQLPSQLKKFYFSDKTEYPNGTPLEELKNTYQENLFSIRQEEYLKYILVTDHFYLCNEPKDIFIDVEDIQKIFICSIRDNISFYQSYISELLKSPGTYLDEAKKIIKTGFLDYLKIYNSYSQVENSRLEFLHYNTKDNLTPILNTLRLKSRMFSLDYHVNSKIPTSAIEHLFEIKKSIPHDSWKIFIRDIQELIHQKYSYLTQDKYFLFPDLMEELYFNCQKSNQELIKIFPHLQNSFISNNEFLDLKTNNVLNYQKEYAQIIDIAKKKLNL